MFSKIKNKFFSYFSGLNKDLEERMLFHIRAQSLLNSTINSTDLGVIENKDENKMLTIISLTTYEKRIYDVYLTIESLMQQTIKPHKIILWLAEEMKDIPIPITLQRQQKRGLDIRYTKDIRSYKKLIPALREYPNDIIITVDDDVLYNHDFVENLVNAYKKDSHCIHCGWAKHLALGSNGKLLPWKDCPSNKDETFKASLFNLPIGCAGVLYPPHSLDAEVYNEKVFMSICKYADDIWFKAMTLKTGYPCKALRNDMHNYIYIDNPLCRHQGLTLVNILKDMNNEQIQAVFDKYDLHSLLK